MTLEVIPGDYEEAIWTYSKYSKKVRKTFKREEIIAIERNLLNGAHNWSSLKGWRARQWEKSDFSKSNFITLSDKVLGTLEKSYWGYTSINSIEKDVMTSEKLFYGGKKKATYWRIRNPCPPLILNAHASLSVLTTHSLTRLHFSLFFVSHLVLYWITYWPTLLWLPVYSLYMLQRSWNQLHSIFSPCLWPSHVDIHKTLLLPSKALPLTHPIPSHPIPWHHM